MVVKASAVSQACLHSIFRSSFHIPHPFWIVVGVAVAVDRTPAGPALDVGVSDRCCDDVDLDARRNGFAGGSGHGPMVALRLGQEKVRNS